MVGKSGSSANKTMQLLHGEITYTHKNHHSNTIKTDNNGQYKSSHNIHTVACTNVSVINLAATANIITIIIIIYYQKRTNQNNTVAQTLHGHFTESE